MIEFGTIGSPFSHDLCSCTGNLPTNHRWSHNDPRPDVQVVMDYGVGLLLTQNPVSEKFFRSKKTFIWLGESFGISQQMHEAIIKNADWFRGICRGIFTHNRDMIEQHPNLFSYVPCFANQTWVRRVGIHKKTKLASIVNSGKAWLPGHHFRNETVAKIMQQDPRVELFGKKLNPFDRKEDVLIDYMFSYTIENSSYRTYITEKLMDCFATGAIPVYHGAPDVGDIFDMRGIIILDDHFDPLSLDKNLYRSMLPFAHENLNRMRKVPMADDVLHDEIMKRI